MPLAGMGSSVMGSWFSGAQVSHLPSSAKLAINAQESKEKSNHREVVWNEVQ